MIVKMLDCFVAGFTLATLALSAIRGLHDAVPLYIAMAMILGWTIIRIAINRGVFS